MAADVTGALPGGCWKHDTASGAQVIAHEHHNMVVAVARVRKLLREHGGSVANADVLDHHR